jgi:serine/threonine protein kinase/tetratricopeptide (TPR) repeat protein
MSKQPDDPGHTPLPRGAAIGRYVVLNLLGRGGMGEVYAAYDPELDRKVAVKLLRARIENGVTITEGRQRTMREAQAIARLSHPNVIVVYDVGTFREQVFIAMEFVDGNTASYWGHAQPRTWQEVLKVYMAAGRGLQAAHEKGMVHRDFKPENVMVARNGEVRVMDFGLARQIEGRTAVATPVPAPVSTAKFGNVATDGGTIVLHRRADAGAPPITASNADGVVQEMQDTDPSAGLDLVGARLTRTGAIMGTPAYMAPEQFFKAATDARSDQFSFCVTLYEALYGERPFPGNNIQSLVGNVVQGNIREPPPHSKVPHWVRRVLLRGLRPTPAERFPSMEVLLEALRKDPRVRYRRIAAGTMVALLPLAFGFGARQVLADRPVVCAAGADKLAPIWELTAVDGPEGPRQRSIREAFRRTGKTYAADVFETVRRSLTDYVQRWSKMYKETCEATQITHEQSPDVLDLRMGCLNERLNGVRALTDVFQGASGEVVENAVSATNSLASLDRCADVSTLRAVMKPPDDPATRRAVNDLRVRLADLNARFEAGRWKDTLKDAPGMVATARTVPYKPVLAEALALAGRMYAKAHEGKAAELALIEAYSTADSAHHDEVRAEVATSLVWVIGNIEGRFQDSLAWYSLATAVLQRIGGHELLKSWLLNNVGCAHWAHHDGAHAVQALTESSALKEHILGSDSVDVATTEANLGSVLREMGRNAEALAHSDRALSILKARLGPEHPEIALDLSNRGEILNGLGRYAEAKRSFEQAELIWRRELGPDAINLAYALTGMGTSFLGEDKPASAIPPLERALHIREAGVVPPEDRAETCFALARALWGAGRDLHRARRLGEEAQDLYARNGIATELADVTAWLAVHPASHGAIGETAALD